MKDHTRAQIYGIMSSMFGLSRPRLGRNKWNTIVFLTHTARILSDDERADRIAHRKKIRHNRQRSINTRGYA